ncbi:MAG TPA: hypothetical protein VG711_11830, partial [Phycisphaerales bacterium]|nr:hypothetical protein [Phycisphaerales bacterium]
DLLYSWSPWGEASDYFPNPNRYMVDVGQAPNALDLPSRSTSTQLYANWMGGLSADWGSTLQADPSNPIRVDINPDGQESLSGRIINNCPTTLRDVLVIWVKNYRPTRVYYANENGVESNHIGLQMSGQLIASGSARAIPSLDAGSAIDLSETSTRDPKRRLTGTGLNLYFDEQLSARAGGSSGAATDLDWRPAYKMLSFYSMLKPPKYMHQRDQYPSSDSPHFIRYLARELDLSNWLTRPCVIVIGYAVDSECPVPLRIGNGDSEPPADPGSITVVRWIYPLPIEDSIAFPPPEATDETSAATQPSKTGTSSTSSHKTSG